MSDYSVTNSSELMENYLQADILLPQDKFIALQTDAGGSLLFSIGTGGVLNLTMEVPGQSHGWRCVDLSSAPIKLDFPDGATCTNFAAAQAPAAQGSTARVELAMVLNDGANDRLYLCLDNSDSDLRWADKPVWVTCPFNAKDNAGNPIPAPSPFKIAGVFISEATDGQYIVVDVIRNPGEPVAQISRFYIDVSTPALPQWKPHDVAFDVDAAGYASCLGRAAGARDVDGIYTMGTIGPSEQLVYTPLYNVFDPNQPAPASRFHLPGGLIAGAIAASRNPDNSSDLFVAAQGGLYRFVSTNQHDQALGVQIASNPLLIGTRDLFAYPNEDGGVTVWGLNGSDEVFYFVFDANGAAASTPPVAIKTGVDAISPYIDRQFSANTFFAHSGNGLIKLVKDPGTGLWKSRNITLPPSDAKQDATAFSSYTTHVQVNDSTGRGAPGHAVSLTAASVTSVYINHLYYIVGPQPIEVKTDELGTVTIVELAHNLAATRFTATVDDQAQAVPEINPMDAPFQRNAQYDSSDKLKAAVITNRDGTTRTFIPAGTSDDDLQKVAQSNQSLAKAYGKFAPGSPTPAPSARLAAWQATPAAMPRALVAAGFDSGFLTDIGDLFSWLESGVEAAIDLVEDAAADVWHFVARIGDAIYYGILDCVEAVVAAVMWVYNAIKVIIEDIILFLEFLFGWQDIITTHRVLKSVALRLAQQGIEGMASSKAAIATVFANLQQAIDQWGGIDGFDQTPTSNAAANSPVAGQNSAPGNLGMHHFQGNAANAQSSGSTDNPGEGIFAALSALLQNEEQTIIGALESINNDIIQQFDSLSVGDMIKRLLAIIADVLLQSTENILNAVLDVLMQLTEGLIDLLSASIDIPVLSWLYHLLTGDDLSILDLICLIAAIPVTLIYKATAGSAPFSSGDAFTEGLINASSFAEIQALFVQSSASAAATANAGVAMVAVVDSSPMLDEDKLKIFAIVFGVTALIGSGVLVVVSGVQKAAESAGFDGLINKTTIAKIACIANIAYVSPNVGTLVNAASGSPYDELNNALTGISIVKSMAAISYANTESENIKTAFPAIETMINCAWNAPVINNLIANKDALNNSYKSLIPETIGNFCFNVGGMMEWLIYRTKNGDLAIAQGVLMVGYGTLITIAGGIYRWAPDQHHVSTSGVSPGSGGKS